MVLTTYILYMILSFYRLVLFCLRSTFDTSVRMKSILQVELFSSVVNLVNVSLDLAD